MSTYQVAWKASAAKQLRKLDPQVQRGVLIVVAALAHNPRPPGVKKLVNRPGWRVRWRGWRVIYAIHDDTITVEVLEVGPRGSIYD